MLRWRLRSAARRAPNAPGRDPDDAEERSAHHRLEIRLALGRSLFTQLGLAQLRALPLPPHKPGAATRASNSLVARHADNQLEQRLGEAAHAAAHACRLMTHSGVGLLTALASLLVLRAGDDVPRPRCHRGCHSTAATACNWPLDRATWGPPLLCKVLGTAGHSRSTERTENPGVGGSIPSLPTILF